MKFDAAQVKLRREARGVIQQELGAVVRVTATTICRIDRVSRPPQAVTRARIAQALGVPIERILHD